VSSAALFLGGALENREEWSLTDFVSMVTDFFAGADEPSAVAPLPALPPPPSPTPPLTVQESLVPSEYQPYHVLTLDYVARNAQVHGDWIYFNHFRPSASGPSVVVVQRMSKDASDVESIWELRWEEFGVEVAVTDDARIVRQGIDAAGNVRIIAWSWSDIQGSRLFDASFDREGTRISQRELTESVFSEEDIVFNSFRAIFTDDGSLVLYGHKDNCDVILYVFGPDGSLLSTWETECGLFTQTREGDVVLLNPSGAAMLNTETGTWNNRPMETPLPRSWRHPVPGNAEIDFYIDIDRMGTDGRTLFGFDWGTEELHVLLHWNEKGFFPTSWESLLLWPDQQIMLFRERADSSGTYILVFPYQVQEVISMSDL